MLYFSRSVVDPATLDLDEFRRVQELKREMLQRGLVAEYASIEEFRTKVAADIEMQIRDVIRETVDESAEARSLRGTKLSLDLVSISVGSSVAIGGVVQLADVHCINEDEIPGNPGRLLDLRARYDPVENRSEFYRRMIKYYQLLMRTVAFRLDVANTGVTAAHNLHLDTRFTTDVRGGALTAEIGMSPWPGIPDRSLVANIPESDTLGELERVDSQEWAMESDVAVVQVGRTVPCVPVLYWQPDESCRLKIAATVYTSDGPPFLVESELTTSFTTQAMTYQDILSRFNSGGVGWRRIIPEDANLRS
jgi:hypothetical protein